MLPRVLKNFNLFNDGESFVGQVAEVELPKLSRKMEEWRGGGMSGSVSLDMGMEKLEIGITCGGFMRTLFKQFGIAKADGVLLRFAGSYERDDTFEVDAVEVVCRGRIQELEPGNAKAGDKSEMKATYHLTYYKLSINGEDLIEIDVVNMIEIIDGVDRLAEQRRAIGV